MGQSQYSRFYEKVARFERARARGNHMVARGTLNEGPMPPRRRRRARWIAPLLLVLACGIGLKSAIHARIGQAAYEGRVATILSDQPFGWMAGPLLRADPVTRWLSPKLRRWM